VDKVEYAEIRGSLDDKDMQSLVEIGGMERMQARTMPGREEMAALNERYFSLYPQTGFRLYSAGPDCDLANLKYLASVQKIQIDSYLGVVNIGVLSLAEFLRRLAQFFKLPPPFLQGESRNIQISQPSNMATHFNLLQSLFPFGNREILIHCNTAQILDFFRLLRKTRTTQTLRDPFS
jgi:hypothetical protein